MKPRGQTIQIFFCFEVTLFSMSFHWESRFLRDLLAVPTASTGCHQFLEIEVEVFPLYNEEVALFKTRVTSSVLLDRGAWPENLAPLCFPPVLNAVYPVFNFIDYLLKKISKVVLGKLFEMFGQRLQVTYEIFCSHGARVGTSVPYCRTAALV